LIITLISIPNIHYFIRAFFEVLLAIRRIFTQNTAPILQIFIYLIKIYAKNRLKACRMAHDFFKNHSLLSNL